MSLREGNVQKCVCGENGHTNVQKEEISSKNIQKVKKKSPKNQLKFPKTIIVACTNLENSNPIDMQLRYNVYNY